MSAEYNADGGRPGAGGAGEHMTRRDALKRGACGAAGLMLAGRTSEGAIVSSIQEKAKSIIQIWLWGGPPHTDTFDPKPAAGYDYCGPLTKTIATNAGSQIGELMVESAKVADKYTIIRSMTHGNNGHETAAYMVQTGWQPGGRVVYPHVGAIVSKLKGYEVGYKGLIPPYVVLTQPQGRFSESGYLGPKYKPFATGGDPGKQPFAVEGVIAEGVSDKRQKERRELLHNISTFGQAMKDDPRFVTLAESEDQAYDLILGDGAKVFDLRTEKDELRDRYGRNTFGQSCLVARRLVEKGVKFITINYQGWDTHKQHFEIMRRKLPEMDKGFATLISDLSERGLLDSTIVWMGGEFGRSPRVSWEPPWNGGRQHFGACFSHVIAGGGFKGGMVVGSSNATGEEVKDRPVYPWDLISTMFRLQGIDPKRELQHPQGFAVKLCPSKDDGVKSGGMLTEII
ncbi:MAG TPA: DUF1501 domain-containing protein [Verrucomicrobiae bacterium]|nr:DUF1501 domain-containing protein [Verrucomicrobiae bacterium]